MPFLGIGLHIGTTDVAVGPIIDNVLKLEQGGFALTETSDFIEFNLPDLLNTEADQVLHTEANEPILT